MKGHIRFLSLVLAVLALSAVALGGCMHTVSRPSGSAKPYQSSGGVSLENVLLGSPASQEALQQKFSAMYEIDEETNTITVISPAYLDAYWQDASEDKSIIHTLSTEEVLYIIQDSIRIFYTYDYVILPAFTSFSPPDSYEANIPHIPCEQVCYPVRNWQQNRIMLCQIISYRLSALASPAAFITGIELCRYQGRDPLEFSGLFPDTGYFFPGYTAETDREMLIRWLLDPNATSGVGDYFKIVLSSFSSFSIAPPSYYYLCSGGEQAQIFPTEEMFPGYLLRLQTDAGDAGVTLALDAWTYRFDLYEQAGSTPVLSGRYALDQEVLTLYADTGNTENTVRYSFLRTGEGFLYDIKLSFPSPQLVLPTDTLLFAEDYSLLDSELPECLPVQYTYYELTGDQQAQIQALLDGCLWICGTPPCYDSHCFSMGAEGCFMLCSCGTLSVRYQERYTCLSPEQSERIITILQSSVGST